MSSTLKSATQHSPGRRGLGLLFAMLLAGCATLMSAPSGAQSAGDDAPPMIAGRVSALEGAVRIWRAEEDGGGQWDAAQINDVVTAGTGITVDEGRVEMRIGPHAFRLGSGSTGGFDQLDFDTKTFALERGVLNVRLAPAQQNERVTLQVADVQVALDAPGSYRIDAIDGTPLQVVAFDGRAVVHHAGRSATVQTGQALALTQSQMSFGRAAAAPLDDWALARDASIAQATSVATQHVSPYMTGYEELDRHGDWVADASFGTVWVPRAVPVGWAPYRDGRWRWVSPWGWTWVDAAPWGFAPFHYGRWVMVGSRWSWWPGSFVARPVWAPALVGFVGGTTVSVGFGGPVVGWYPLAPWHAYRPVYRVNPTYVTVINQTIIQRPPRGVPHDLNQRPGSTWVPDRRFRDPIVKVRIPEQSAKVGELRPAAPPPRPVVARTGPRGDEWRGRPPVSVPGGWQRQPAQAGLPEQRVGQRPRSNRPIGAVPPAPRAGSRPVPTADTERVLPRAAGTPVPTADNGPALPRAVGRPVPQPDGAARAPRPGIAQPMPAERPGWRSRAPSPYAQNSQDFRVAPPQPMPGSDRSLSQPAPIRKVEPRQPPRSQDDVRDRTQRNAGQPPPAPRVPQELVPPYQQLQRPVAPAEPARTPPAAPPTIRQPATPPPQRAAPPASPPQRSGAVAPAPRGGAVPPVQRVAPRPDIQRPMTPKQSALAMER